VGTCPHRLSLRPWPSPHLSAAGGAFQEDAAAHDRARQDYDHLSSEYESAEQLPDDADQRFGKPEAEIERIGALRHAYDPDEIARGGMFVVLSHDRDARIKRGFIRAEDEKPDPAQAEGGETAIDGVRVNAGGEIIEDGELERTGTAFLTSSRRTRTRRKAASGCPIALSATCPPSGRLAFASRLASSRTWRCYPHTGRTDLLSLRGGAYSRNPSDEQLSRQPRGRHRGHRPREAAGGSS